MQNYALNGEKEITLSENDTQSDELLDQNRYRFVDMMPQYKIKLEEWMDRDKPYLNKDFKLIDVMNVLPLNRSYLSRMFNDLYGETFLSFVMRYRIKESTHLLSTRSDITISYIALICGFSSPSVFGRAFMKIYGVTPKQYRMSHIHKDENAA
ncbi:MAG: AraC family transcriptional regulator [Rikenellaceae bacterium]